MTDDNRDLAAQLRAARAALDRALALLGETDADMVPAPAGEPEWLPLKGAARECGVHPETMAARARAHGLGLVTNRVWRIDMVRVRAWREGRRYARLAPTDSASSGNISDAPDGRPAAS
jgi:hypothetical protein